MIDSNTCSECLGEIQDYNKIILHNNWLYCDAECLNDRIIMDLTYAWVVFKNLIDKYHNEPFDSDTWGSQTLVGTT